MPKANRKYKDSVFTMYFSNTERLIELYNSLEGTNLPKDTPIEINTLDDALFKDRINDISFVINGELVVLIEHQSTLNENMPVRFLLYVARVYEKILETENVYRSSRIPLPTPKFVVLYNGLEPSDEFSEMRLSDAFILPEKAPMLDLMVRFFNINYGKSPSIMEKCHSLNEYSTFVFYVRKNQARGLPLNKAIAEAVNQAIHNNVMKDFLSQHGSEVENMLFEEWKWEEYAAMQKAEGREEGHKEGRKESQTEIILNMAKSLSPEEIAKLTGIALSTIREVLMPATT